jgi:myo-inositol catabolism protein IolC
MSLGYTRPLYLLPFDHRHSYLTGLFHVAPPLTSHQISAVVDTKQVIYEGFTEALGAKIPASVGGILVDEEFGAGILRNASQGGYTTALSVEKSGSEEFQFEYGSEFIMHIEMFAPTFAKALVRYNPEGDAALNARQTARLKQLSDYCRAAGQRWMFELLVPPTKTQKDVTSNDPELYALRVRPKLMVQSIRALQDAGVEPDIWKIEGLDLREDCERIVATARRGGREEVGCIVLGHGADEARVVHWLEVAAPVPGFIGIAVGRTTFWNAIAAYVAKSVTRNEAAALIARRYNEWATIFNRAKSAQTDTAARAESSAAIQ